MRWKTKPDNHFEEEITTVKKFCWSSTKAVDGYTYWLENVLVSRRWWWGENTEMWRHTDTIIGVWPQERT